MMWRYRQRVRELFRRISEDAPLFPQLPKKRGRTLHAATRVMSDAGFIELFRSRCRLSGLPDALTDRLTFHSFRSGGATDYFDYGAMIPGIVQFIMKQGRWAGPTFRIYLRLRSTEVAMVAARVMRECQEEARREKDPAGPCHARFHALRMATGEAELSHRTHGARPRPRLAPPMFAG